MYNRTTRHTFLVFGEKSLLLKQSLYESLTGCILSTNFRIDFFYPLKLLVYLFNLGGILILEAQGYASYNKRRKLTSRIAENYQEIQFRPEQFSDFLLNEVGFSTTQVIGVPRHPSKGFQRPIQVS